MDVWSIAVVLCIAVVALEVTWVLRRGASRHRGYLALLMVDGALLGYTISEPRFSDAGGGPWPELVAGVALCGLLVFVPRLLDRLIRSALGGRRVALAARLAGVKEILQPGRAATVERELLVDLARARSGEVDEVVRGLRERLALAGPEEEGAIHERIVTTLAFAGRWREATTQFDQHIGAFEPQRHPALAIQMVQAFGEIGELERAGQIVHRLELAALAGDPNAAAALLKARLTFLAGVGGKEAIDRLLALPALAQISPRTRGMLQSVAVSRRAGDPRNAPTEEVLRFADLVADRIAADLELAGEPMAPKPRASMVLVALNVIAFALVSLLLLRGAGVDHWFDFFWRGAKFGAGANLDFVRAGASFHPAVRAGEWWRLWSAMFLHGGESWHQSVLHILLNMYGLYLLGRIVEPVFGWQRFLLIYAAGGLAGNLASAFNPSLDAVISLGASGAVMGLMGALLVVLRFRRNGVAEEWRRSVLVNLLVLTGIQLAFGLVVRVIDNYAHIGGLVGGAAAAWLLMPEGKLAGRFGKPVVWLGLAAIFATAGLSVVRVVRSRPEATLAALPRREEQVDGIHFKVPEYVRRERPVKEEWPGQVVFIDPVTELLTLPHVVALDGEGVVGALRLCMERDRVAIAREAKEARSEPGSEPGSQNSSPPPLVAGATPPELTGKAAPEAAPQASPAGTPAAGQAAPQTAQWIAREQDRGGERAEKMLYFGRAIDTSRALVVEATVSGSRPLRAATVDEIGQILASMKVDPGAPPPSLVPPAAPKNGGK